MAILALPFAGLVLSRGLINISLPNLLSLVFVGLYVAKGLTDGFPVLHLGAFQIWSLVAMITLVAAVPFAQADVVSSSRLLVPFLGAVILFPIGAYLGGVGTDRPIWESALLASAVACAVAGIGHYFGFVPLFEFEREAIQGRAFAGVGFEAGYVGLIAARGDYGMWAIGGAMVAGRWIYLGTTRRKILGLLALPLLLGGVVVTLSRTSWIAMIVSISIAVSVVHMVKPISIARRESRLVAILAGVVTIGTLLWLSGLPQRIFTALVAMKVSSYTVRFFGFQIALDAAKDHPFVGAGLDLGRYGVNYHWLIHNSFLALLASLGLPAALLLVFVAASPIVRATRIAISSRDRETRILAGLWIGTLVGVVVQMSMFDGLSSKYFWMLIGIASSHLEVTRRREARATPEGYRVVGTNAAGMRGLVPGLESIAVRTASENPIPAR
jgi:O-antigen ligase